MAKFKLNRRDFLSSGLGISLGVLLSKISPSQRKDGLRESDTEREDFASQMPSSTGSWPVLSNDSTELNSGDFFDVLVIGSGYGASVISSRLSASFPGKSIAVLERGKEWFPGDFPQSPLGVLKEVKSGANPLGLLDTNAALRGDMDVVSANGLGGTSLLNAAIALEPKMSVFQNPNWPREIREDAASGVLSQYYNKAHAMLRPMLDPYIDSYRKVEVLRKCFSSLGAETVDLRLNIAHMDTRQQGACVACGDCCGGCNVGAKNTLPTSYLASAKQQGAKIYTKIEVRFIEEIEGGKWKVHCLNRNVAKKSWFGFFQQQDSEFILIADKVVLGAGSRGSTEILLRSKNLGLPVTNALGARVSANGDVLGMCYNGKEPTHSFSQGPRNMNLMAPSQRIGQAIMLAGDYRRQNLPSSSNDFVFLEGSIPSSLVSTVAKTLAATVGTASRETDEQKERVRKDLLHLTFPSGEGALGHSTMFLACGHDSSGGRYELQSNGDAKVSWHNPRSEESILNIKDQMKKASDALGGTFIENPWENFLGRQALVATHPLGGCPMGDRADQAVVNHKGQVFKEDGNIYKNLYVVDGATISTSLAAPPLLTITALAERAADHMIQDFNT